MTEKTPLERMQAPAPVTIDLDLLPPDARIVALFEAYPEAKAQADAAAERVKAITDGIKAELASAMADTGTEKIVLKGKRGAALRLAKVVQRRFDSRAFSAKHPDLYEAYRKPSESWRLEAVDGGR